MRISDAVDGFLFWCAVERRLSVNTVQAYASDLRDLRREIGAADDLSGVTLEELRSYLATSLGKRQLSPATTRRRLACFRAFFRHAAETGGIADPFSEWKPAIRRQRRLPRALSRGELAAITEASRAAERDEPILEQTVLAILMLAATGLRISELCAIQIEDVAVDAGAIRVLGKGARDRVVYLSNHRLRTEIQRLRADRLGRQDRSRALFLNSRGGALTPATFRKHLHRLVASSDVGRRVTPHMLRHTAATLLIESGVDIRYVQRLLGHASIATTEIYTHVSDESLRTTLERADAVGDFI